MLAEPYEIIGNLIVEAICNYRCTDQLAISLDDVCKEFHYVYILDPQDFEDQPGIIVQPFTKSILFEDDCNPEYTLGFLVSVIGKMGKSGPGKICAAGNRERLRNLMQLTHALTDYFARGEDDARYLAEFATVDNVEPSEIIDEDAAEIGLFQSDFILNVNACPEHCEVTNG